MRDAVSILDRREDIDFEYEGEMNADVALSPDARRLYPFSRLTDTANVLIMPALHSASIAANLLATTWRRDGDRPGIDGARRADSDCAAGRDRLGYRHVRHRRGVSIGAEIDGESLSGWRGLRRAGFLTALAPPFEAREQHRDNADPRRKNENVGEAFSLRW